MSRIKIVVHVPPEYAEEIRRVLGDGGAGIVGNYTHCSFSVRGTGRFTPATGAIPTIGSVDSPEEVAEESIEVVCDRSDAKQIVAAVRAAHPYEEPAIEIYELIDENDLS